MIHTNTVIVSTISFNSDGSLSRDLVINSQRNIGNGAFGAVMRGTYKGRPCAVKLLTHHAQQMATGGLYNTTAGIQVAALDAFRRECDFLKTLKHDNIVRHLENFTEPNSSLQFAAIH